MGIRIWWGFVLGTVFNLGLFMAITWANGTPVPSVLTPVALLEYPTGSVWATWAMAAVIYFIALVVVVGPRILFGKKSARLPVPLDALPDCRRSAPQRGHGLHLCLLLRLGIYLRAWR